MEKGKVIVVKMAKATDDDIRRVREFFQMVEEYMDFGTYTPSEGGRGVPLSNEQFVDTVQEHWGHHGPGVGAGAWFRVVDGMAILLSNCCDPDLDYLEFKPEIKAAMERDGAHYLLGKLLKDIERIADSENIDGGPIMMAYREGQDHVKAELRELLKP